MTFFNFGFILVEKSLSVTDARNNFSEVIDEVRYLGNTVVLHKSGKRTAAIIPIAMYEKLLQLQGEVSKVPGTTSDEKQGKSTD